MTFLGRFVAFWYDFVVGDDWVLAAGGLIGLVVCAAVARSSLSSIAWLVLPIAIVLTLAVSLRRAVATR
jgi:hypothetical protein